MKKAFEEKPGRLVRRGMAPIVEPGLNRREGSLKPLRIPFHVQTLAQNQWRIVDEGQGEPLLVLGAYGQSPVAFRNILTPLAQHFRVLMPLYPGWDMENPQDELPRFDYAPEQAAKALAGLLRSLGISRIRVLAVGEGAALALYLDRIASLQVLAAVLISPGGLNRHYPLRLRMLRRPRIGRLLCALPVPDRVMEGWVRTHYFDQTMVTPQLLLHYQQLYDSPEAREAYYEAVQRFDDASLRYAGQELELLRPEDDAQVDGDSEAYAPVPPAAGPARQDLPLLILHGENDRWHPPQHCPYIAAHPQAQSQVLRNCGSLPHVEKPDAVMQRVLAFMG